MRQAIGQSFDEEYKLRVRTLFAALPNFTTFDTAVDVIDVDAEEDMMPTPKTKKKPFELQDIEIKQEVDSLCWLKKAMTRILSVENNGWWICFLNP